MTVIYRIPEVSVSKEIEIGFLIGDTLSNRQKKQVERTVKKLHPILLKKVTNNKPEIIVNRQIDESIKL